MPQETQSGKGAPDLLEEQQKTPLLGTERLWPQWDPVSSPYTENQVLGPLARELQDPRLGFSRAPGTIPQ